MRRSTGHPASSSPTTYTYSYVGFTVHALTLNSGRVDVNSTERRHRSRRSCAFGSKLRSFWTTPSSKFISTVVFAEEPSTQFYFSKAACVVTDLLLDEQRAQGPLPWSEGSRSRSRYHIRSGELNSYIHQACVLDLISPVFFQTCYGEEGIMRAFESASVSLSAPRPTPLTIGLFSSYDGGDRDGNEASRGSECQGTETGNGGAPGWPRRQADELKDLPRVSTMARQTCRSLLTSVNP